MPAMKPVANNKKKKKNAPPAKRNVNAYGYVFTSKDGKKTNVTRRGNGYAMPDGRVLSPENAKRVKLVSRVNKWEQTYRLFNMNEQFNKLHELNNNTTPRTKETLCPVTAMAGGLGSAQFKKCLQDGLGKQMGTMFAQDASDAAAKVMCGRDSSGKAGGQARPGGLQQHQLVVYNVAKMMAAYGDDHRAVGGARGLLVWHNTGSGKTLSSLAILLAYMRNSEKFIFIVTTVDNRKNNNAEKYAENCAKFFPDFPGLPRKDEHGTEAEWIAAIAAKLKSRARWMSFEQFANFVGVTAGKTLGVARPELLKKGAGSVVLMDEAQSIATPDRAGDTVQNLKVLFSADPAMKGHAAVYKAAHITADEFLKKVHVYALTATPGNSVEQWIDIMTFVRRVDQAPFRPADWAAGKLTLNDFRGLLSYVEMRDDRSRYATEKQVNIAVPMDPPYFAAYMSLYSKMKETSFQYDKDKPRKYLEELRKAGTFLNKTGAGGYGTWYKGEDMKRAKDRGLLVQGIASNEKLVSTKFKVMMEKLTSLEGKQYVYAVFGSVELVVNALRDQGYVPVEASDLTPVVVGKDSKGKAIREQTLFAKSQPAKRYVLYKDTDADKKTLEYMRDLFSARKNADGDYCKVLIASGTNYQGLDVTALRGVHLLEPLFSDVADQQARGRGRRNCGHSMLPADKRNVTVYRYWSVPPAGTPANVTKLIAGNAANAGGKGKGKGRGGGKGKAGPQEFERAMKAMMERFALKNLRDGGNAALFDQEYKRNDELRRFELCMKSVAVDCAMFREWHKNEAFQCGEGGNCMTTKAPNTRQASNTILIEAPNAAPRPVNSPAPPPPRPANSPVPPPPPPRPANAPPRGLAGSSLPPRKSDPSATSPRDRNWVLNVARSMAGMNRRPPAQSSSTQSVSQSGRKGITIIIKQTVKKPNTGPRPILANFRPQASKLVRSKTM